MVYIVAQPGIFSGADNGEFTICGLVGIAGSLKVEHDKIFKQLLLVDSLRGVDSTGMCLVPANGGPERIVKALGNPFDFMDSAPFTRAFSTFASVLMGHNRFATQGKVSKVNAHPFEVGDLIGMHNGTLLNKWELADSKMFDVDSENLYHHISEHGLRAAMDVARGAWSLVWWDKKEATLNFLRNDERPMHMAYFNGGKTVAWASEVKMLDLVLHRNDIFDATYHETEINLHYSFPVNHAGVLGKPTVCKMAQKNPNKIEQKPQQQQNGFFLVQSGAKSVVVPTTAANNTETKVEKKSIASQIQRGYVSSRDIKLELIDYGIDEHGQRYIHCFDEAHPYLQIRLYVNKGMQYNAEIAEGDRYIRCDIKEVSVKNPLDIYYKVAINSVTLIPVDAKPIVPTKESAPFDVEDEDTSVETMFKDHRGRYRSIDDWNMEYGTCASCTGYVDPMRTHKFAMNGEAICHCCVADKQIMATINVM